MCNNWLTLSNIHIQAAFHCFWFVIFTLVIVFFLVVSWWVEYFMVSFTCFAVNNTTTQAFKKARWIHFDIDYSIKLQTKINQDLIQGMSLFDCARKTIQKESFFLNVVLSQTLFNDSVCYFIWYQFTFIDE